MAWDDFTWADLDRTESDSFISDADQRKWNMNELIDKMSHMDCCIQINALLFSYGLTEDEIPNIMESNEIAFRKLLKAIIKIGPKRKIMIDGVFCDE